MADFNKKIDKLISEIELCELEGLELKIFVSEKVMESVLILVEYFDMFIKKKKINQQKKKNTKISNNSGIMNSNLMNNNSGIYSYSLFNRKKLDQLLKRITKNYTF